MGTLLRGLPAGERHAEGERRQAVFACDGDVLLVLVQNGLDHVEPEAHAVLILGAGFVALVEALEQQRDLLGGDGLALVANRDQRLAVERRYAEIERGALAGEFCRVFEQVVDCLLYTSPSPRDCS